MLLPDDLVTIDITLRSDGEAAFGAQGSVIGYDESIMSYVTGSAVPDARTQI